MPLRAIALLLVFALLIGGCANEVKRPVLPKDVLTRTSFGPLVPIVPPSCTPEQYPGTQEIARQLTALIAKPFANATQIDSAIQFESLTDSFTIPGDVGTPPVFILERNNAGVVFWHNGDVVPVNETTTAAQKYCGLRNKQMVWQGSARRCGGVLVDGQRMGADLTMIISAYQCIGNDGPQRSQRPRG